MDYIILKSDGSLKESSLSRYIQQGNTGVDKIFVGWADALATDICEVVFTKPNQTTKAEVYTQTYESAYNYDGTHTSPGWIVTLYSDETDYNGCLFASVRIIRGGIVQVAYPFTLVINETGVRPDTDSGVTIEQLDSYLLNLQSLVTGAVQANTDSALSNTSENPVQNKVVTGALTHVEEVAEGKCKSIVLDYAISAFTETTFNQVQGAVYAEDGTEISTWADYQTYISGRSLGNSIFNSQNATITINKTDYYFLKQDGYDWVVYKTFADFKTGDILLVVETEVPDRWFSVYTSSISFYKMETAKVDITNMMTTDTDQTVTGVKTFNNYVEMGANGIVSYEIRFTNTTTTTRLRSNGYVTEINSNWCPRSNNSYNLGNSSYTWKDLYLSGKAYIGSHTSIYESADTTYIYNDAGNPILVNSAIRPLVTNTKDLGSSSLKWNNIWGNTLKGITTMTQDQYDAITPDADTFYFIEEE